MLSVSGAVKRFPGVTALDGVSITINPGEIVAVIGENGAGKSTLMKILGGIVRPDEGEIRIDGRDVEIDSVSRSVELGIALIHQELSTLDNLDVAANVFLGREPARFGFVDQRAMREHTSAIMARLKMSISPDEPVAGLSLAQRQMVEIAKALSLNARYLIMDEPTSSLTLSETDRLLSLARELRDSGTAIVFITHRLAEAKQVADRVVALKDGRNAGELSKDEIEHDAMVRLMVGRDLDRMAIAEPRQGGRVRLKVDSLKTARYPDCDVSFDVAEGEVFCLAGLVGAGRSEVVQTIFGTDRAVAGRIEVDGASVALGNPKASIECGIGLVPEDRRGTGLLVEWNILENITLPTISRYATAGLIRRSNEAAAAQLEADALHVRAPNIEVQTANLSGGNQQKVVVAKWLLGGPKVLILDEPTRGVDVGAKAEIYEIIRGLTNQGLAVLMVSSDMEEVLSVSDRVGVMHEGRLTGILPREKCTEEAIMQLAVGGTA